MKKEFNNKLPYRDIQGILNVLLQQLKQGEKGYQPFCFVML